MATFSLELNGETLPAGSLTTTTGGAGATLVILSPNDSLKLVCTPDDGESPSIAANGARLTLAQLRLN